MSTGDLRIVDLGGNNVTPVRRFIVKAGKDSINAGEPVRIAHEATTGGFYVIRLLDAEPVIQQAYFLGIAANAASHTSSADGTVDVYLDQPGTIYAASPKTANDANTQAKLDSYLFYRIVIDRTSNKFTADLAADSATRAFVVIGGNPERDEVHFYCADGASWRDRAR